MKARVEQHVGDNLTQLIQPYIAAFMEKHQAFVINALQYYLKDSSFWITAKCYETLHLEEKEVAGEVLDKLLLLSYLMQLQTRILFESQARAQATLRKFVGEEFIYPLEQFLTLTICQLVAELAPTNKHLAPLIAEYFKRSTEALFEAGRQRVGKQYEYNVIREFKLYGLVVFPALLAGEVPAQVMRPLRLAAEVDMLRNRMGFLDVLHYIEGYARRTDQLGVWQTLVLEKFSQESVAKTINVHLIDQKIKEEADELAKSLHDALTGMDPKWEWLGLV